MTDGAHDGIEAVIELLTRLAAGDYDARGVRTGSDEDLDAVVVGINMLAEELGAHRAELEDRVRERTVELEAARREAMEASRLKSEFLATMSHEIRTPMNGVLGLTQLLLRTELDRTQRQYAEGLRDAGEALLAVINDVLDFSKLEAGMVDLEPIDLDPRSLVEGVAGLLALTSAAKQVELIAYCTPAVPARMVGDEGRLRQILLNLASNAVKFTDKGEVVISADVTGEREGRVLARFQVADTGIGIPEDARATLFESFTQGDASTTRRYGGTGLGLAISRSLTHAMGGSIGVDSEVGVGSTFWFEVPLPVAGRQPQPAPEVAGLAGLRAIVVDDNATNRLVLESQLGEWGLRVAAVERPAAVVPLMLEAVADGDPYAFLVLDMCMPDIDGLELARLVSADVALAGTPMILLSSTFEVDREELLAAGVGDYLRKPVRSSELRDRLVELVRHHPGAGSAAGAPAAGGGHRPTGRVLVVEDNEVNQLVAEGLVTQLGYEVEIVANGAEAVDAVTTRDYVAVLMDCHMPVMDGYAAARQIRELEDGGRRVPIIAMTAAATAADRERSLAAGMDDYVSKPVDPATLGAALRQWARTVPGDEPVEPVDAVGPVDPVDPDGGGPLDPERVGLLRSLGPGGGGRLLAELTEVFLATAPDVVGRLRAAVAGGDPATARQAAHELAGAAANVGASRLADLARAVEGLAAAGTPVPMPEVDRLDRELDRAGRALREAAAG